MNIKRLIAILALATFAIAATAQPGDKPVRIAASVTVGPNGYSTVSAFDGTLAGYETEAPSTNWMDKGIGFGAEASVLLHGRWRIDVGGAFDCAFNPGYSGRLGTVDAGESLEPGDIPEYRAVAAQQSYAYVLYVGGSYYFDLASAPALKPYVGVRVPLTYAINSKEYNESASMGRSLSETLTVGLSAVVGVDYFFSESFYVGASLDGLRYRYSYTAHKPQEGLGALAANAHNIGFLAAPMLKVGFLF